LLTPTVSADVPGFSRMVQPDLTKALETIDQVGLAPTRLRLSAQSAELLWAQQLRRDAMDPSALNLLEKAEAAARQASRRVATQPQSMH
jgi:hypothetical protein